MRHKLKYFPQKIKSEIEEAVNAARESNMIVINQLKERLESTTKRIEKLTARDVELTKSISVLQYNTVSMVFI